MFLPDVSYKAECFSQMPIMQVICVTVTHRLLLLVSAQKKLPLTTLAQCMVEGAAVLGDESLLG